MANDCERCPYAIIDDSGIESRPVDCRLNCNCTEWWEVGTFENGLLISHGGMKGTMEQVKEWVDFNNETMGGSTYYFKMIPAYEDSVTLEEYLESDECMLTWEEEMDLAMERRYEY